MNGKQLVLVWGVAVWASFAILLAAVSRCKYAGRSPQEAGQRLKQAAEMYSKAEKEYMRELERILPVLLIGVKSGPEANKVVEEHKERALRNETQLLGAAAYNWHNVAKHHKHSYDWRWDSSSTENFILLTVPTFIVAVPLWLTLGRKRRP